MSKSTIKAIPVDKVEKLIATIEYSMQDIEVNANKPWPECMMAVGNAEATLRYLLKQLKGEYPI